ncbi:MAG: 3-deoxy-7-phosphoheptulonate synthase [Atopobiaceae bacterium]
MIATVKQGTTKEQLQGLLSWIQARGFRTDVSRGQDKTIIGIVGDTSQIDPYLLESLEIIDRVQRVSEPFKLANRKFHPEDSSVDCGFGVKLGHNNFQVIAGPCFIEQSHIEEIAQAAKEAGATLLQGAAFKPRTSPYAFHGIGAEGLKELVGAAHALKMPVVSEVVDPRNVETFVDAGVDVIQIGSKNAQNYALLSEVGKTEQAVLLKRGRDMDTDEFLLAAEYVMSAGNTKVILCERGTKTADPRLRATFDINALPTLHELTHLPVIVDASHAAGFATHVERCAAAAVAAGADGLEIEINTKAQDVPTDGAQALDFLQFAHLMHHIRAVSAALGREA